MSWNVTLGGNTYSSLDLTLNEVEALERISGQSWALINPFTSIASAKAYLAIFAMREGQADDVVLKGLDTLTVRELVAAFEWVDDEKGAPKRTGKGKGKELDPPSRGRTSRRGSTTARSASNGPRTSPVDNA